MHFRFKKALAALVIAASMVPISGVEVSATSTTIISNSTSITTPYSSLPKNTKVSQCLVTVNSSDGTKTYRIFEQGNKKLRSTYIRLHGCAACSLTTVLSAYSKKYANYTPEKTSQILEKKVFGTSVWKKNYTKNKMPVSLNGITKILKYCGIKAEYVRSFKDADAVARITAHLKEGKPVIIETNCRKQSNGKYGKYTNKWAGGKHTMVLLGIASNGKVIVADSANRTWAGKNQRIKYTKMSSLVHYMYPCKKVSNKYYYSSQKTTGGYILVD